MSTEYLIASSESAPSPKSLAGVFPKGLRVTGDWKATVQVGDKLAIETSARDPRVKDVLPAARRKSVFVARGDFDLARALAKHVRGVMISEDGEILERFDVAEDAPLPKTMFIVPKKAGAALPDNRYVWEFLSSIGDPEGDDWKLGYSLYGVHLRATKAADKQPAGAVAVVSLSEADPDAIEDAVAAVECMVRLLKGKLVAQDGSPVALPSF